MCGSCSTSPGSTSSQIHAQLAGFGFNEPPNQLAQQSELDGVGREVTPKERDGLGVDGDGFVARVGWCLIVKIDATLLK